MEAIDLGGFAVASEFLSCGLCSLMLCLSRLFINTGSELTSRRLVFNLEQRRFTEAYAQTFQEEISGSLKGCLDWYKCLTDVYQVCTIRGEVMSSCHHTSRRIVCHTNPYPLSLDVLVSKTDSIVVFSIGLYLKLQISFFIQ